MYDVAVVVLLAGRLLEVAKFVVDNCCFVGFLVCFPVDVLLDNSNNIDTVEVEDNEIVDNPHDEPLLDLDDLHFHPIEVWERYDRPTEAYDYLGHKHWETMLDLGYCKGNIFKIYKQ